MSHFFRRPTGRSVQHASRSTARRRPATRRLRLEPLEDRRLLAVVLVSSSSASTAGNGYSWSTHSAMSADGQLVVFESDSTNLGWQSGFEDIYLKNLTTGVTSHVGTSSGTVSGSYTKSLEPAISDDGRYLAMEVLTIDAEDPLGSGLNLYRKDLQTGSLELVEALDGYTTAISGTGRYVAFWTAANDICVKDLQTGTTTVASNDLNTLAYPYPDISADGRYVAYSASMDDTGGRDIYVWDRQTETTKRVTSVASATTSALLPTISDDGRYVAYTVEGSDYQACVKDLWAGTTLKVNSSASGVSGNGHAYATELSADGRYAFFYSRSTNLIDGQTTTAGFFVKDLQTDATALVAAADQSYSACHTTAINADGQYVTFTSGSQLYRADNPLWASSTAPTAITLSNASVAENSVSGTVVGTLATTGGTAAYTYTLLDSADGRFKISGDQLLVDDGSQLDYETATNHVIQVRTTDAEGLSYDVELTIRVTDVQASDTVALYDPSTSTFRLLTENTTGADEETFAYGAPDAGWTTLVGDWNGDGTSDVGLYDPSTSTFYLTGARVSGVAEYTFGYGVPDAGWEPLVGDWNGDGKSGVGLYDPSTSCFYLTDALSTGVAETTFAYGVPDAGWEPLVGDWNGDGQTSVGLYDPHSSCFYLTDTLTSGYANYAFGYGVPDAGWTPLVGDWNGDGAMGVGLYDTSGSTFYLTDTLSTGTAETTFGYGVPGAGWTPLVGDWNSDSAAGVGLYDAADATFFLSDHPATGVAEHTVEIAGASASAVPLVGAWTEAPTAAAVDQLDLAELAAAELEPPLAELLTGR